MEFIKSGNLVITEMIENAMLDGSCKVTVSGNYEIEDAILLPSNLTLILDNCHLRLKDGSVTNVFRNAAVGTERSKHVDDADRNIRILGVGRAIIDGGEYNGLSERNSRKDGNPHVSLNNLILFSNVDGFEIRGLKLINQRWWAMNFLSSRNGHISDVEFCSCPYSVMKDGSLRPYLSVGEYESVLVKNSDGIDLRAGCHDILIENITGFTEDDTIALTALSGATEDLYCTLDGPRDIYNIIVRNVRASSFCSIVRLLNQGNGTRLFNILVDGVFDTVKTCPYIKGQVTQTVRIGDSYKYGKALVTKESVFNITIKNVFSSAKYALRYDSNIGAHSFDNILGFDGCDELITTY